MITKDSSIRGEVGSCFQRTFQWSAAQMEYSSMWKVLWKHGPKCLFSCPKSSSGEHRVLWTIFQMWVHILMVTHSIVSSEWMLYRFDLWGSPSYETWIRPLKQCLALLGTRPDSIFTVVHPAIADDLSVMPRKGSPSFNLYRTFVGN